MEFQWILGVDMSKEWFDFCLMNPQFDIIWEGQVDNRPEAISKWIDQLQDLPHLVDLNTGSLVMEHTGLYVKHLLRAWLAQGAHLALVPASKVSEKLTGAPGWVEKTDRLDARRLAEYGHRFADQLNPWQAPSQLLEQLQHFQRQRQRLLDAINLLEVPIKEIQAFEQNAITQSLLDNQQASIKALKADYQALEKQINRLIEQDPTLANLFELITSVEGIGAVTAREILISTAAFTRFSPHQAKAFARYAGVVPLERSSGKTRYKKARIAQQANGKIKRLLTMGAIALTSRNTELGHYYRRKKQEGKPHMAIINAMRNKMILRVFAVVRNQLMYQKNLNICLD